MTVYPPALMQFRIFQFTVMVPSHKPKGKIFETEVRVTGTPYVLHDIPEFLPDYPILCHGVPRPDQLFNEIFEEP